MTNLLFLAVIATSAQCPEEAPIRMSFINNGNAASRCVMSMEDCLRRARWHMNNEPGAQFWCCDPEAASCYEVELAEAWD